jgi:hypothetical protein
MKIAILAWLFVVAAVVPAAAQEPEIVLGQQFEERFHELAQWLEEYEVWGNRVEHTVGSQPIWERRQRPQPPAWLHAECQDDWVGDGLIQSACYIVAHWDEEPLLILQRRQASLRTSGGRVDDEVVKRSFLQRIHVMGLWMEASYPATPAYGIVGMQLGVFEAGRLTLPAVGFMLVMIPDGRGGQMFKPATTLGFGYRILDFMPPFLKTPASLHLNVARTQLHAGNDRLLPGASNVHLFGLSVSTRRRR